MSNSIPSCWYLALVFCLLGIALSAQFNAQKEFHAYNVNALVERKDIHWMATSEGLNIFPRAEADLLAPAPRSNIVKVNPHLEEHRNYESIKLSMDKNKVSISYSGLYFGQGDSAQYEYRLLPTLQHWSLSTESSLTFFDLQPGEYTFEVRAIDHKKRKGIQPAALTFAVQASFTQSPAFKWLLGGIAMMAAGFYWRRKAASGKFRFQKIVAGLELQAIKAQINPHFIYNSLNSVKNTILKKDITNAEKQLSLFANMVRRTLIISQKNFIGLDQEMVYLRQYLEMEKMRFKACLNFKVVDKNISEPAKIKVPTMLFQPFVENAIKHGVNPDHRSPCEIQVRFTRKRGLLYCEIEDNGPGLNNRMQHQKSSGNYVPQGMLICAARVKAYQSLYGMDIKIKIIDKNEVDPLASGVLIKIEMPLRNDTN